MTREDLASVAVAVLNNEAAMGKTFVARNTDDDASIDLQEQLQGLMLD